MNKKIVNSVFVILGCSVAAKILAYLWDATLAALFGASDQADAFYMMVGITGILYPILDIGIWKVFLPAYKARLVRGHFTRAQRISDIAGTFFLVASAVFVLLLIVSAKPLVLLMAPGFSAPKQAATVYYLRLAAPAYLLMAFSSLVGAVLQSQGLFFGSQVRELGTHVSKLLFLLLFFRRWGIVTAVVAMTVGSVFRLLVQLPFLDWGWRCTAEYSNGRLRLRMREWKWRYRPNFHFRNKGFVRMLRGLPSVALTAAISYINSLVDRIIASWAGSGSIACLNYGHKLVNVFSGMISSAIGTATYPTMIQYIAEEEDEKLEELLTMVISALIFLILPISAFCMAFSRELVKLAFERGAFDAAAADVTAAVFLGYAIGMLFDAVTNVVSNVFYGFGDTKTTMRISALNVALNIGFNLVFIRLWGVAGLAFATSLSSGLCLLVRLAVLRRYIWLDYGALLVELGKIALASVCAVVLSTAAVGMLPVHGALLRVLCAAALVAALGLPLALILRVRALRFLRGILRSKLGRGKAHRSKQRRRR